LERDLWNKSEEASIGVINLTVSGNGYPPQRLGGRVYEYEEGRLNDELSYEG